MVKFNQWLISCALTLATISTGSCLMLMWDEPKMPFNLVEK